MSENNQKISGLKLFLYYLFFHYITFQVISILRATGTYNTAYLANYSNIFISLYIIFIFFISLQKIRLRITEVFLLFYPILHLSFGIIINGLNRNTFSHLYTSVFFAVLLILVRNSKFEFTKKLQLKFANWMFWGLLISIISYKIAPYIGIKVYSIGVVSIFSLFPLIVFFQNKEWFKVSLTIILLILGGKRGVLLSGLLSFIIIGVGQKSIKKTTRFIVIISSLIIFISLFYVSMSPSRITKMPSEVQPMLTRMMHTNPFSDFNRIYADPRVREVEGAIRPLVDEPISIITGRGGGYSYEYTDVDGNFEKTLHNTHFSPVAVLTRYGIVYLAILYIFIIKTLYLNYRIMKANRLSFELIVLLMYAVASFVNSFTAFTLYLDYLFILCLGLLNQNQRTVVVKKTKV